MNLKGERIIIRPLKVEDVFFMRNWGYHDNPLLSDYNFPTMSDNEVHAWYKYKTLPWFNRYFAVLNEEDILIGYMGIKNIKKFKKESTLGIVFDPNYIEQGYGSETLKVFLNYYFKELEMRKMYLEVAEFNERAYKVYENIGFKPIGYYLDLFDNSSLDLNNSYYLKHKSSFVLKGKKIYNYIYKMKLTRADFYK
ncbi:MAG: GNAT family N-acetyltransferase [Tissierellia bacterium]|jgi:RimJ/RimL family protein N-acetyltransferase|nr:GNAT family N-acetyltransferase [Tissierellia bacterium]